MSCSKYFLGLMFILSSFSVKALPPVETLAKEALAVNWVDSLRDTVIIEAPVAEVWSYLSDSTKASEWSIFFDHISPLPGIPDGQIGSVRRCYRNANEKGFRWDEVTIMVKPQEMRVIITYNLYSFPWRPLIKHGYVFVRQVFRSLDSHRTELTFETQHSLYASRFHQKMFYRTADDVLTIFHKNLQNIKANIEGTPSPYPFMK